MGMAALLLSFGLILAGCPTDTDPDPGNDNKGVPEAPANVDDAAGAKKAVNDILPSWTPSKRNCSRIFSLE
jgi:hypothetical protein